MTKMSNNRLPDRITILRQVIHIQFYNLKTKEKVEVADDQVEIITMENGRKAAKAELNGMKLFKFLSKADAEKFAPTTNA